MKKIIIFLVLCSLSIPAFTQGNLEFNRVRYIQLSTSCVANSNSNDTLTLIVPTNKVFKMEAANVGGISTQGVPVISSARIFLDGVQIAVGGQGLGNGNIVWLPAGSYLIRLQQSLSDNCIDTAGPMQEHKGFISGIEFNVIP